MKKRNAALLLVLGILLLPVFATANQIELLYPDQWKLVEFTFPDSDSLHDSVVAGTITGQLDAQIGTNSQTPGNTTDFFCIDLLHTVQPGPIYNYEYFDLTENRANAAKLVKAFASGLLDAEHGAGLQAAVWSVIYPEQFNLVTGGNIATYMQQYLDQLNSGLPAAPEYRGLDLFTVDASGQRIADYQDLIDVPDPIPAPEPGTFLLLSCGLLGLLATSRRRWLLSLSGPKIK